MTHTCIIDVWMRWTKAVSWFHRAQQNILHEQFLYEKFLKHSKASNFLFLLVMRMEAENLSQGFAESSGLLFPLCGSAASSTSWAAADVPIPDPWGKPEGNKGEEINESWEQFLKDLKWEDLYNIDNQTSEKCTDLNFQAWQKPNRNLGGVNC